MVSLETFQAASSRSIIIDQQQSSSPRISFSAELLDDDNFISISPNHDHHEKGYRHQEMLLERENNKRGKATRTAAEFDFLSSNNSVGTDHPMLTADELFFEGKLLPSWQMHHYSARLNKITLKSKVTSNNNNKENKEEQHEEEEEEVQEMEIINKENNGNNNSSNKDDQEQPRISNSSDNGGGNGSWFVDDDPSPRPPKCTVLWKELLRLKKQRPASTLSPSSSSSSTSSSSSSLGDIAAAAAEEKEKREKNNNTNVKRVKKALERTRSATIRIRPMVNVPICTHNVRTNSALPPLFPLGLNKKGRLER